MAITITDNGASLKITNGLDVRNIMKNRIQEIVVIKDDTVKIDNGNGALDNVFLLFADVTIPLTANVGALRDAITTMCSPTLVAGTATEAKQTEQSAKLDDMNATLTTMSTNINDLKNKTPFEPSIEDKGNSNVVYRGFANPGSSKAAAVWAIQRVTQSGQVYTYEWADGNKNFDNIWNSRASISYS